MSLKEMTVVFSADDVGTVFADGKQVAECTNYEVVRFSTSSTIKILAINVINFYLEFAGTIGFILQSSTGIVSDQSWKCKVALSDRSRSSNRKKLSTQNKSFNQTKSSKVIKKSNLATLWTSLSYNDSDWTAAVCYARNGDNFYFTRSQISGIAANTCWISLTEKKVPLMTSIYCRKRLQD